MQRIEIDVARINIIRNVAKLMSKYELKIEDLRPHLESEMLDELTVNSTRHDSEEAKAYFESLSPPSDKDVEIEGWKLKMILM